jgi:hypothetical protein
MKQPRLLWFKLRDLLSRHRNVRKLDDEIRFHIDQQTAENIAAGMSPEQVRYTAMRLFGKVFPPLLCAPSAHSASQRYL